MTKRSLVASAPLGVLAFWGGLWMAARHYPSAFDWRYMTISSLLYPDRNPDGYRWAWGGLTLCALGGLCWTIALVRHRAREAGEPRPAGIWPLAVGYLCMACCVLLSGRLLPIPRIHETLSISALAGLCVGIVQLTLQVAERIFRSRSLWRSGNPRIYAGLLAGLALSPVVLAGVTPAYVSYALPELPWVGLEWRVRGVPVVLSFAFWEWITCAVFSTYLVGLCAATTLKPEG
ncbi:MAG: hypothetical protein ACHQIL_02040 [Steroidobacterales bacterium]